MVLLWKNSSSGSVNCNYIQMHRREPEVDTAWQPEPLDTQMALNSFWMATPAKQ